MVVFSSGGLSAPRTPPAWTLTTSGRRDASREELLRLFQATESLYSGETPLPRLGLPDRDLDAPDDYLDAPGSGSWRTSRPDCSATGACSRMAIRPWPACSVRSRAAASPSLRADQRGPIPGRRPVLRAAGPQGHHRSVARPGRRRPALPAAPPPGSAADLGIRARAQAGASRGGAARGHGQRRRAPTTRSRARFASSSSTTGSSSTPRVGRRTPSTRRPCGPACTWSGTARSTPGSRTRAW
jgi:hypothetical protein